MWNAFDYGADPRVVFGRGSLDRLGELARAEGFRRTLVTADPGLVKTPHVERALHSLRENDIAAFLFRNFDESPDCGMAERGRAFASECAVDSIVGLGGGSSMDCAKAVGFLLTNGGRMQDYWGFGKATSPLPPMIGVPTTSGTGSEAQSYALVSDAETHVKMACGDPSARFRIAILDPELTLTQPASVTAVAGYDAIAHAVETYVTTKRNPLSDHFAREAFRLLSEHYERVLLEPDDLDVRSAMQLGAYYAGVAIDSSMLGATHACANPLSRHYGTIHGKAIAMCLATVVRYNDVVVGHRYRELHAGLATRLEDLATAGGLPTRLREEGVTESDLPVLAREAAEQWTGTYNPRPFDESAALEIYRCAY